jgi:hypothetical protein
MGRSLVPNIDYLAQELRSRVEERAQAWREQLILCAHNKLAESLESSRSQRVASLGLHITIDPEASTGTNNANKVVMLQQDLSNCTSRPQVCIVGRIDDLIEKEKSHAIKKLEEAVASFKMQEMARPLWRKEKSRIKLPCSYYCK